MSRGVVVLAVLAAIAFAVHSGPSDTVLVVDGLRLTRAEFARLEEGLQPEDQACLRETFESGNAPAEAKAHTREYLTLNEMTPTDVLAASTAVLNLSTQAEATRRGITPSDDEVRARVKLGRDATESTLRQPEAMEPCGLRLFRRRVEAMGFERYRNELLLASTRRSLELEQLMRALQIGPEGLGAYQSALALHAQVEAGPALPDSVSLDAIRRYLGALSRWSSASSATPSGFRP